MDPTFIYTIGSIATGIYAGRWFWTGQLEEAGKNWVGLASSIIVGLIASLVWPLALLGFGGHHLLTRKKRRALKAKMLADAKQAKRIRLQIEREKEHRTAVAEHARKLSVKQWQQLMDKGDWQMEYAAIDNVNRARRQLAAFRTLPWDKDGLTQEQHGLALFELGAKLITDELRGYEMQALQVYLTARRRSYDYETNPLD